MFPQSSVLKSSALKWQQVCFFRGEMLHETKPEPARVLVVDDDDAIRTMVERVLRREQFQVDCARDGHEAIEKLSKTDYGSVILDLMMPRVDGLGVLRFLETVRPEAPPTVIVMTANVMGAEEAGQAKPAFRVVAKPFDICQLVRHVRDCLDAESAGRPN